MQDVIARTEAVLGPLAGVVHLAGATSPEFFGPASELDSALREAQFRPKAAGARTLARALDAKRLDFVLLASSISTVLGGLGFAAYAAANAYMEAFAERQTRAGSTPWVSVAWEGRTFTTSEDRAARTAEGHGASTDSFALTAEEGLGVLDRILAFGRPSSLVVSTCDLRARIEHLAAHETIATRARIQSRSSTRVRRSGPDYTPARDEAEHAIVALWEELLGIRPIRHRRQLLRARRPFAARGADDVPRARLDAGGTVAAQLVRRADDQTPGVLRCRGEAGPRAGGTEDRPGLRPGGRSLGRGGRTAAVERKHVLTLGTEPSHREQTTVCRMGDFGQPAEATSCTNADTNSCVRNEL